MKIIKRIPLIIDIIEKEDYNNIVEDKIIFNKGKFM